MMAKKLTGTNMFPT